MKLLSTFKIKIGKLLGNISKNLVFFLMYFEILFSLLAEVAWRVKIFFLSFKPLTVLKPTCYFLFI